MVVVPPLFFSESCADHRDLHSFPTRRSSDLRVAPLATLKLPPPLLLPPAPKYREPAWTSTSDEHTSVLQALKTTVCGVLLPYLTNDPLLVKVFVLPAKVP